MAKTYGHLRDTHSSELAKRMIFSAHADAPPSAYRRGAPWQSAVWASAWSSGDSTQRRPRTDPSLSKAI
jgi:hypothetical protein